MRIVRADRGCGIMQEKSSMISTAAPGRGLRQGLVALAGLAALGATMSVPAAHARTAPAGPARGGSIAIADAGAPDCLDPQKTGLAASEFVFSNTVDPLFSVDAQGKIRPYLATGYTYNASGTEITIALRHGVRFSNGDPFNASAVKYTFDRAVNPATKSPASGSSLGTVTATQVVDPYTVRLVLKTPYRPLLALALANPYLGILDPKTNTTCTNVIGTGPYKIQSIGPSYSTVTLVRNSYHTFEPAWGYNQGAPYLDKIVFRSIVSDATTVSELLSGGVDLAGVSGTQVSRVQGNASITQHRILADGESYLGFNTAHSPFNTVAARRAVAPAIDRRARVTGVYNGLAVPAYSPVPSTLPFYDRAALNYAPQYDVTAAQKALAGTNVAHGRYTLLTPSNPPFTTLAELIQAELGQVGINVNVVIKPLADFVTLASKGQYDMLVLNWTYPDPDFNYLLLDSSQAAAGGLNFTNYKSTTLDNLLVKGRTATDSAQAAATYAQMQRFVDTNVIIDPLATPVNIFGTRAHLKGWHTDNVGNPLISDLYVAS